MISHQIVVHKEPPIAVPSLVGRVIKPPEYSTQEQYEAWLKKCPFKVGDYVTLLPSNVAASSLMQTNCITKVGKDFKSLEWSSYSSEHKPFFLVNLNLITDAPWTRWDSMTGYRHLTANEIKEIITPVNDKLQAHRTKHG